MTKTLNNSTIELENSLFGAIDNLEDQVAVYIPSTLNANEATDSKRFVDEALVLLSDLYGGSTATPGLGGWNSPDHGLITEDVTIVYAYTSGHKAELLNQVYEFAQYVKDEMSQEMVSVEINKKLYFI